MSRPTFYPLSYQGSHSISVPTTSSTLNMVTSVKKVVFTKSTTPVWMLPGTPVAQWESAGLLIFLLPTKIVLLWLKYYLKGHKSLLSIQLNIYDVVTQICIYNYTYYFELSFENLTPPNMQLQLYILSWVIFYQSCCVFSKQNWFKIFFI